MLEFEKALKDIKNNLRESKSSFRKGWKNYEKAKEAYESSIKFRKKVLQDILDEKGLAICSKHHIDSNGSGGPTEEKLGIFPKDNMRLFYFRSPLRERDDEYGSSFHRHIGLNLLCPEHFPSIPNFISDQSDDDPIVMSEVTVKDGKYTLVVNGNDITELVERGGIDINPKGNPYPGNDIYRYFGIPDLPKEPDFDSLHNYR